MTPIFVRPVREQLEHDRLIRFLHAKFKAKRKLDVLANVGDERQAPIKVGNNTYFPDLILLDGKKVAALIEIETGESTNNLEAMAQWTHFSRARVPFHLYVPVLAVDAARRLCESNHVLATEVWSYRPVNDQFDLVRVHLNPDAVRASSKGSKAASLPVVLPPPKPVPPPPPPPPPAPVVAPPVSPKLKVKAEIPQAKGGHMRLIIGYNNKTNEIIYSDSWGAKHAMKRMPSDNAFPMTTGLYFMEPSE